MSFKSSNEHLAAIKLNAEQHEVIETSNFKTVEEYVLHLMHLADYEHAKLLAKDCVVLDLGCNGGHGTSILAESCRLIVGIDISTTAINSAISRYASQKASFQLLTSTNLPFPDHYFDLVTSFQVIEHLVDYHDYLSEIRRVLKPNGLLLITTPNAAIRLHVGQKPWNPFHVREFRHNELYSLLNGTFNCTRVIGQFATQKTYSIEYNRCIRARGSDPSETSLFKKAARKSWRIIVRLMRMTTNITRLVHDSHSISDFKDTHSLKDIFYKSTDLDNALTLVACCSVDEIISADAVRSFETL